MKTAIVPANMHQLTKRFSTHGVTTGQQLLRTPPPAVIDIVHQASGGELHTAAFYIVHSFFAKTSSPSSGRWTRCRADLFQGCMCVSHENGLQRLFIMLSMTRQEEGKNRIKGRVHDCDWLVATR